MAPWLSIVIPARNDAAALARTLDHLLRLPGMHEAEVIVAAAGDPAGTARAVAGRARLLRPHGSTRAELMNAGAADARGAVLFFLHADSFPPADAVALITRTLNDPRAVGGAFEHRFAERVWSLRAITWINRMRYRLTHNYYGDQGQFVRAAIFRALGGYRPLRLMEDLDFAQRLKRRGRSVLIRTPLITSGRRFLARGPWRTFFLIVWLLARWTLRLDTERYAEKWRGPANRTPGTPWSKKTNGAGATRGPDPLGRELSEAGPHPDQPTQAPTRPDATRSNNPERHVADTPLSPDLRGRELSEAGPHPDQPTQAPTRPDATRSNNPERHVADTPLSPDLRGRELSEAGPHPDQPTHAPTRAEGTRSK
jgi:rSAM/selenodomain-associated transferase 2